jgi:hypothetical protein
MMRDVSFASLSQMMENHSRSETRGNDERSATPGYLSGSSSDLRETLGRRQKAMQRVWFVQGACDERLVADGFWVCRIELQYV